MKRQRFVQFIKPYRYLVIGALISLVIFTFLGLLLPWCLKIVIDEVLAAHDFSLLWVILGVLALIYTAREIMFYISHYLTFYVAQRFLFDVRNKLFRHLQAMSLRFYEEYRTGKLISNVITDVNRLQQMVSSTMLQLAVNCFSFFFVLSMLFYMNWKLTLVCFLVVPLHILNFFYFRHTIKRRALMRQEMMSQISANLAETLNGVRIVKSFARERSESRSFVSTIRHLFNMNFDINMRGVYCWMISDGLRVVAILGALGMGSYFVASGEMTIGDFVAFYAYLGMLFNPIVQLSNLSPIIAEGKAALSRISGILDQAPEITEAEKPLHLKNMHGKISFENVTFGYNGRPVVKDFNLKIEPGKTVALVGPSGSGKSTIANLLLRFYDVDKGRILVDGKDIRELKTENYRSKTGVVLQDSFLFSGTVAENICYGRNDATYEQMVKAAKRANAHDFISELEDGYDTKVGENGVLLSGGQKQRLAIARAILKDPKIMILDEATSALDTESELAVQEALDELMKDRTTLVIAHRLSTIREADTIVVMKDGRIAQTGSHDELMARDGLYRDLYNRNEPEKETEQVFEAKMFSCN